ncbi:FMN-dependent dehydrogenase-domain-containing protein [Daldinia caldariorum]|uniref:FMN-dependent dehydrogenase-domain-containing protein n=1 Tax=Daldinia caldariorum TaxID=326644 RepID=UPI0020085963|nr:FMN-dependent dehydrogenase-domain-containing protein [Daldinia caldariorum]KAI1468212.1 FMN-dependent dehydrogenase-domain-containing protein [Daldinia caldariorum]
MLLDAAELAKHNTASSCWIVVDGKVYDVTPYLEHHPGGAAILVKQGGTDATAEFRTIHSPDVLEYLPKGSYLGEVTPEALKSLTARLSSSTPATNSVLPPSPSPSPPPISTLSSPDANGPPHIAHCVAVSDFEPVAKAVVPRNVFSYISSSANSGLSLQGNLSSWSSIKFRPRILRDVERVSAKSAIFGHATPFPFYVSAMGMLGRGHPNAEAELVRGLARRGAHAMISSESSLPMEDIAAALSDEQRKLASGQGAGEKQVDEFPPSQLHFQLYVHADHSVTLSRIRRAKAAGFRSIWVTVDTACLGKRTADRRVKAAEALEVGLGDAAEQAGVGRNTGFYPSRAHFKPSLSWEDLVWIKKEWGGPLVLKGVQCAEDAKLALEHGCEGILLSNHGGRQAHTAPDALTTLLEIRTYCPEVLGKLDIFVDGGLRDGADVLKAICLGATAVGVGRPFFYALAAYGSKGVERCIDILSEELATGMRLTGIASLDEAQPDRVNASRLLNEMWHPEKSRL